MNTVSTVILSFVMCHLSFPVSRFPFPICHLPFAIWHLAFGIWHLSRRASGPGAPSLYCAPDQKSRRFAVPVGMPDSLFNEAALTIAFLTVAADAVRLFCR